MKTLIKDFPAAGCLLSNYFVVEFIKGLKIEKERITSFTYDKDKDEFEFTMPLLVGENPDNIIKELSENINSIDFKIYYTDKQGNIVFEKKFNSYKIESGYWTLVGNYNISEPISVKFTLQGDTRIDNMRRERDWVL